MGQLTGKKIAILVTNGFEQSEFEEPIKALRTEGAIVEIVSPETRITSWKDSNWGIDYDVDKTLEEADPDEYDGLVLPGGVMNPDQLRTNKDAVNFVASFMEDAKPIGAICHGPWTLIETGHIKGRTLTSFPSLKSDLTNAGATWVDHQVVVDNGLVTSRNPTDLPAFCSKLIEEISEGKHRR